MVSQSYSSISPKFRSTGGSFFGGKSRRRSSLFAPVIRSAWLTQVQEVTRKYLNINLVSAENHGNVLTDTFQVAVPVGDVLVGDTGCDVEHDDTALTLDIVTITEATELLLASSVPHVEEDSAEVCREG